MPSSCGASTDNEEKVWHRGRPAALREEEEMEAAAVAAEAEDEEDLAWLRSPRRAVLPIWLVPILCTSVPDDEWIMLSCVLLSSALCCLRSLQLSARVAEQIEWNQMK